MMFLRITWINGLGCSLATRTAADEKDAALELIAMIKEAGELQHGDKFYIDLDHAEE